ncbi:MAG: hypothetical protein ACE5H0_11635, partial [Bacteroidota bacterium]
MDREIEENAQAALLRSRLYQSLAVAFLHPNREFSMTVTTGRFFVELEPLLKSVIRSKDRQWIEDWQELVKEGVSSEQLLDAYQQVFSHTLAQTCPPCEMEYERTHVFQLTQQLADLS